MVVWEFAKISNMADPIFKFLGAFESRTKYPERIFDRPHFGRWNTLVHLLIDLVSDTKIHWFREESCFVQSQYHQKR